MVDYDGADIVKTYLNGLNWTGASLTEPSYYEQHERSDTMPPNTVIIREISIDPEQITTDKYYLNHLVELRFNHTTKVLAFANLKFIIKNLINYSDETQKMSPNNISVEYSLKRKIFIMTINVRELLDL